ncbi:MAG: flavodoxin family protein [Anaerolineae bacterium]
MAELVAVLGSGRAAGYTAGLLDAAIEGASEVAGVTLTRLHLRRFAFGPCQSCFSCIRKPGSGCVQDDDMGRAGRGALYAALTGANALLLVDAVHMWGPTAYAHLLFERLYPTIWTGELNGLPFASVSCASNQGMQHLAREELCKWARSKGMRYVGGLAVHLVGYEAALTEARALGRALAEAAVTDAEGRRRYGSEAERFLAYIDQPFDLAEVYLANLTQGTMDAEQSLPLLGIANGAFAAAAGAQAAAQGAQAALEAALGAWRRGDEAACLTHLSVASSQWTTATWLAFLQERVVGAAKPAAYKPVAD